MRYEALIESPEREARALLDFCGLEWDDACLRAEETQRVALTASYAQVRQPISKRAVGRARHYRHRLGPLIQALELGDS